MIYRYSNAMLQKWNRGDVQVRIDVPGKQFPMGYCDGTEEDEAEIRQIAEEEDVENVPFHKRYLKTGREIWTVGEEPEPFNEED